MITTLCAVALLAVAALALAWRAEAQSARRGLMEGQNAEAQDAHRRLLARLATASILAFAALFLMRFTFYMSHLTLGLGV